MNQASLERGFSADEAARLSKLSERKVMSFADAGIVGRHEARPMDLPRRGSFDFRDISLLKTVAHLIASGVPARRVRTSFAALRDQLPESRALSSTRVEAKGRTLVAYAEGTAWEPESGQLLLKFERESQATLLEADLSDDGDHLSLSDSMMSALDDLGNLDAADFWFDRAVGQEDENPQAAYDQYIRALSCNPEHLEATINIGRLCSSGGDLLRAAAYFRQAVRLDATHPVAQFNLAVTLHDLNDEDGAIAAYRAALRADPNFADAHFNIATLLEQRGDRAAAIQHLHAYDRCTKSGSES